MMSCVKTWCVAFRQRWPLALAVATACLGGGCAGLQPQDHHLVDKPNMEFSDSLVFRYQNRLLPQVEPGYALSGGAQTAGASCCK